VPLHPQVAALLAQSPRTWHDLDAIATMTAEKARAMAPQDHAEPYTPPGVSVEHIELPGPLPGLVFRPAVRQAAGVVLWIQGGGFVIDCLFSQRTAGPIALASGCTVVCVGYRLAPEHPFPAALEDCYRTLSFVASQQPGVPIAIGGESAGGNLAAATTLLARDRGGPEPALQALVYPMVARTFAGGSRHDPDIGALARPEAIDWLWQQYLAAGHDGAAALASPLDAADLAGLPPALVITAEYDVLRDEGEAYADRLAAAGVPVERRRYDGMHHSFADLSGFVDTADACIEQIGAAFRRALEPA
jgi:acetyl esterase